MAAAPSSVTQRPTSFYFEDAGGGSLKAWLRYKLKECWALVQCLMQLRGVAGPVIVHNWWGGVPEKFTREFRDRRAGSVDPVLANAPIVLAHDMSKPARLVALAIAVGLVLLPVGWITGLARAVMPRALGPLVVYCDGHLSGFVLVRAAQGRGVMTYTLHHGLYRSDDRGSVMGIVNFTSDRICLWDDPTRQGFVQAGVSEDRLLKVGEYGFGQLSADGPLQDALILLCPPYDVAQIGIFKGLGAVLPETIETIWSLHPMLRKDHPDLTQATIATVDPRPAVAICGDSGALMDALARHIPILTVADRPLASAHLTRQEAQDASADQLAALLGKARAALAQDRRRFGFDDDDDVMAQEAG